MSDTILSVQDLVGGYGALVDRLAARDRAGIAAEKCGGAVTGRFASLRVNP